MKKEVQVIMLPTENDKAGIYMNPALKVIHLWDKRISNIYEAQELSFLYDEDIKWGDSYYNTITKEVGYCHDSQLKNEGCIKIIASTDTSIIRGKRFYHDGGLSNHYEGYLTRTKDIPYSFVEEFVKSNGTIDKVMVEFEKKGFVNLSDYPLKYRYELKVAEYNAVIVHPVEK